MLNEDFLVIELSVAVPEKAGVEQRYGFKRLTSTMA
jgi:hypothetical protein